MTVPTAAAAAASAHVGPDGFRSLRGYPELQMPSKAAQDPEVGRELWEFSAELTNTASTLPVR